MSTQRSTRSQSTRPKSTTTSSEAISNPSLSSSSSSSSAAAAAAAVSASSSPPAPSSSLRTTYLVSYNFISALLWIVVLCRTVSTIALRRAPEKVYDVTGEFTKWTQTLALLEVVHSLLGVVRAPIITTALQVASRTVLVWAIVDRFPVERNPAYGSMLIAWSATEVVRYSYFVFFLTGMVPPILSWLRYNMFFVLYPLGISSEVWLVYKSLPYAQKENPIYGYIIYAIFAIYVPGSYVLYSHMMAQRRRVMRGKQRARD